MVRLARAHNRIFYVETIGIRSPGINRPDIKRVIRRFKRAITKPHEKIPGLVLLSPMVLPSRGSGLALKLNRLLFLPRLKRTLKMWHAKEPIVWIFNPYAVHYLKGIPHSLLIYHCVDDLTEIEDVKTDEIYHAEKALLERADLVFATSPALVRKCRAFNQNTHLQTNVGDFEHFNKVMKSATPIADAVAQIPHPILMFAGNLAASKVNFELIEYLANKRIDWSVVLIGPLWNDVSPLTLERLKKVHNLYLIPPVPYTELPRYLKAADILIIPYHLTDYTACIFPIKFFEFLATGKPVVTTALPSLEPYAHAVNMSSTYQGFMNAADNILKDGDTMQEERLELAKKNTWNRRLDELSALIEESLNKK